MADAGHQNTTDPDKLAAHRIACAEREAHRFLARAAELASVQRKAPGEAHPRQHAALKRASMDLTRALADVRRSKWR